MNRFDKLARAARTPWDARVDILSARLSKAATPSERAAVEADTVRETRDLGAMLAIRKALGTEWQRGIGWHDIEVHYDESGKPVVGLRGGARDIVVSRGVREILVSISYCRSHAVAYAMALGAENAK